MNRRFATLALLLVLLAPAAQADVVPPETANTITLRDYVDSRFAAADIAVKVKLDATDKALDKAQQAMDKRLEGMNEFRAQLNTQAGTFVTRTELYSVAAGIVGLVISAASVLVKWKS